MSRLCVWGGGCHLRPFTGNCAAFDLSSMHSIQHPPFPPWPDGEMIAGEYSSLVAMYHSTLSLCLFLLINLSLRLPIYLPLST